MLIGKLITKFSIFLGFVILIKLGVKNSFKIIIPIINIVNVENIFFSLSKRMS